MVRFVKPRIRWSTKFHCWDCTDGVLHGGGDTPQSAYDDFCAALHMDHLG